MIERRHRLLGSAYKLFYDNPVHIVRGEGVWLFDADGRKFLDMYNNVPHVGHCHPHVVEALTKQIATLNTHTRYLHDNILDYAERLTSKFEDELCRGVQILITDRDALDAIRTGMTLAWALRRLYPDAWEIERFARLLAEPAAFENIRDGAFAEQAIATWLGELEAFGARRARYLVYR
jgi:acetylornithine/succinyldiaminopimelate/putrescine aminotransferase